MHTAGVYTSSCIAAFSSSSRLSFSFLFFSSSSNDIRFSLIQYLCSIDQSRLVLHFIGEGEFCKPFVGGKPLTVFVHHYEPLESAKVGKAENDEYAVAPLVNFVESFTFGDYVAGQVGGGCFGSDGYHLEGEWVCFGEG